jgi:AcrR family transcriptional regulator
VGRTKTIDDIEILKYARQVFREGGHAASTREVAKAAGISQAALYQRFGSKEDLFFKAMTPDPPDLDVLLGSYSPHDARADLESIAARLVDFFASLMPTLLHVLAHPSLGRDRLVKWHAGLPFHPLLCRLTERFTRMRKDGLIGPIGSEQAALVFLAAVHSAALFETMSGAPPETDRRPRICALVATLWQGFAPPCNPG